MHKLCRDCLTLQLRYGPSGSSSMGIFFELYKPLIMSWVLRLILTWQADVNRSCYVLFILGPSRRQTPWDILTCSISINNANQIHDLLSFIYYSKVAADFLLPFLGWKFLLLCLNFHLMFIPCLLNHNMYILQIMFSSMASWNLQCIHHHVVGILLVLLVHQVLEACELCNTPQIGWTHLVVLTDASIVALFIKCHGCPHFGVGCMEQDHKFKRATGSGFSPSQEIKTARCTNSLTVVFKDRRHSKSCHLDML